VSNLADTIQKPLGAEFSAVMRDGLLTPKAKRLGGMESAGEIAEEMLAFSGPTRRLRLKRAAVSPLFPFQKSQQAAAEQYRIIRTKILHSLTKPKVVLVSSVSSGDGKTVTAINVAAALALKQDASVLLIDCDLRRPRISEALGIPASPGLSDVLAGRAAVEAAVVQAEQFPNLFILPTTAAEDDGAELLDSARWPSLLKQARAQFSHVICDAPPVASVADYELLQMSCDSLILVARPGHTDRSAFLAALENIAPARLLGVVLNDVQDWFLWKTPAYGYSYGNKPE